MTITYSIISGDLPEGTTLNENGNLFGTLSFDLPNSPVWTVNTVTYIYNEFDNVTITFDVAPNPTTNAPIDALGIISGDIPWGLIFNASAGTLTGQVLNLIPSPGIEDSKLPKPTWTTASGNLGTFDEFENVSVSINAIPGSGPSVTYGLYSGLLPWGIVLNSTTGNFSGIVSNLLPTPNIIDELLPKPTWVTASGNLGTFNEFDIVFINVEATPTPGNTIVTYGLLSDNFPWGLKLNTNTGVISGTVSNLIPTDITIDQLNNTPTWITPSGSLGVFNELININITLNATPASGSSIAAYEVIGELPWGSILNNNTGTITGTLREVDLTTIYNFQIRVIDNNSSVADRSFSITVNNI